MAPPHSSLSPGYGGGPGTRWILLGVAALLLTGCGNWAVLMPTNPNGQKHLLFLLSGIPLTLLISFYSIIFGSIYASYMDIFEHPANDPS